MRLNRLFIVVDNSQNTFLIKIDGTLQYSDDQKNTAKEFIKFCAKELNLKGGFEVALVAEREKYGIKTTASYDINNHDVKVYSLKRMLGDVMRSVAHELVHKMQNDQGRIKPPVQDEGGEIEDEANAMAGLVVKRFIKHHELGENLFA